MKFPRPWIVTLAFCTFAALALAGRAHAVDVTLIWTSPGDDGINGTASAYDIRMATFPIGPTNFDQATRLLTPPAPRPSGSLQIYIIKGLQPDLDYWFAMKSADERGNWSALSNIAIHTGEKAGVGDSADALEFSGPWPNPVREVASFSLALPQPSAVRVDVYDVTGRRLGTLVDGDMPAGKAQVVWALNDVTGQRVRPGLYILKAQLGLASFTRRVMVTH